MHCMYLQPIPEAAAEQGGQDRDCPEQRLQRMEAESETTPETSPSPPAHTCATGARLNHSRKRGGEKEPHPPSAYNTSSAGNCRQRENQM